MDRRSDTRCIKCNEPACGEPPLCEKCFEFFFRHDPAANGSPGIVYCGGCDDCHRVKSEYDELERQYYEIKKED